MSYEWSFDNTINPIETRFIYDGSNILKISNVSKSDQNKVVTCKATEVVNQGMTSESSRQLLVSVICKFKSKLIVKQIPYISRVTHINVLTKFSIQRFVPQVFSTITFSFMLFEIKGRVLKPFKSLRMNVLIIRSGQLVLYLKEVIIIP